MNSWDKLSMAERAEIMKLAVQGGIYDLDTIRKGYNEYAEGGSLPAHVYSGEEEPSQQMQIGEPNLFRRAGKYFYQASPESEEVAVEPVGIQIDHPRYWTYRDSSGRLYTPKVSPVVNQAVLTEAEPGSSIPLVGPLVDAANKYVRELEWRAKNDPASIALQGKYTMPAIAAASMLPLAGEAAYPILTNPYVDAGMKAAFAGHGLNHWINEGIDGPVDAAMTALELAPLGELAWPMYQAGIDAAKSAALYGRKNVVMPYRFYTSLDPQRIDAVNNAFRNQEWSNFLATRNGDNYYRLSNVSREARYDYSPDSKYFMSHTTPWEEFSGMSKGITDPAMLDNGKTINYYDRLYEFPTKTFGKMKSSGSHPNEGYSNYDVTEMGNNHLLFGETSSGSRDFVRVLSDKNAQFLDLSPFKIGVSERPLKTNGFYDTHPVYEDIHMGNQTIVDGTTLNNAIQNTTYNLFERTPFGILRTLHLGE